MPRYYFNLRNGEETLLDSEGTELADHEAARGHAHQVMQELMRNASTRTRSWRLVVSDHNMLPCFECLFASHDESIAHLAPELRSSVETAYRKHAALTDAIIDVRASILQIKSTLARSDSIPHSSFAVLGQASDGPTPP